MVSLFPSLFNSPFPITRNLSIIDIKDLFIGFFPDYLMGTCCSAGSRICQPFDPCQGVSWTVRGQEGSPSRLSNPSLLAATFLIRVRNLAETRSEVTTAAWPGQNPWEIHWRDSSRELGQSPQHCDYFRWLLPGWVTSLVDETARTLGRSDDHPPPPLTPCSSFNHFWDGSFHGF